MLVGVAPSSWARSQGGARARGEIEIQFTKFERAEPGNRKMERSRRVGSGMGSGRYGTKNLLGLCVVIARPGGLNFYRCIKKK